MINEIRNKYLKICIDIPEIYIPNDLVDLNKWAVIACDQYTSQPEYWKTLKEYININPSTLNMVLPEIYLDESGIEAKVTSINSSMYNYLNDNIIHNIGRCFIYIQRQISPFVKRNGLLISIDLEHYDFNKGSTSLIRSTEDTIIDRLPPRVKIRENAPLEIPHILMLIDDPSKSVIEPLSQMTQNFKKIYDFKLYKNNNIKGFKIDNRKVLEQIYSSFKKLTDVNEFNTKYNLTNVNDILLMATGDGNHSLAAAKVKWDKIKNSLPNDSIYDHPARFALVEVVNIHDESLVFEPIHRILTNIDPVDFINSFIDYNINNNKNIEKISFNHLTEMEKFITNSTDKISHYLPYKFLETYGLLKIERPTHNLEIGTLQNFIDIYSNINKNIKLDYIHGKEIITQLSSKENSIGFYLPSMNKNDFFKTVILDGSLPRKTFSMGEAPEKRYYLECKKIK